jgi:hypothetical protein
VSKEWLGAKQKAVIEATGAERSCAPKFGGRQQCVDWREDAGR